MYVCIYIYIYIYIYARGYHYLTLMCLQVGTELMVTVRGKSSPAVTCKMPFVPTRYYKVEA